MGLGWKLLAIYCKYWESGRFAHREWRGIVRDHGPSCKKGEKLENNGGNEGLGSFRKMGVDVGNNGFFGVERTVDEEADDTVGFVLQNEENADEGVGATGMGLTCKIGFLA
jgi:hypothetical protein